MNGSQGLGDALYSAWAVHSTSSDPSDTAGHLSGVEILAAHWDKTKGVF